MGISVEQLNVAGRGQRTRSKLKVLCFWLGLRLALVCLLVGCRTNGSDGMEDAAPRALGASGYLTAPALSESSGLLASSAYPGVFWTLNDSGDHARIFAIRADGTPVSPKTADGIRLKGAVNRDWESLARAPDRRLIVADIGNNGNQRKNLTLYFLYEPDPAGATSVEVDAAVEIHYPEQTEFPPKAMNYDCEAVFGMGDALYFLTKNRSDAQTSLYRLKARQIPKTGAKPGSSIALERLGTYALQGMVTAADAWDDTRVAVLTYGSVWVFESGKGALPLSGPARWLPIRAGQCESIVFVDADTLLVGNEQRSLFTIDVNEMYPTSLQSE